MDEDEEERDGEVGDEPESLMGIVAASALGEAHQAMFERLAQPYFLAMINGQLFEAVCRLAEPALSAPGDDDAAAQAVVAKGQGRTLHNAIGRLIKAGRGVLPADLVRDLDAARERRNVLAHDMLWLIQEVIAGRGEKLIAVLEADAEEFGRLAERLTPLVLLPSVEARGLSSEDMMRFIDAAGAAMALAPEHFAGVDLKRPDPEELLERFRTMPDLDPDEVDRAAPCR